MAFLLIFATGPAFASQLAFSPGDTLVYGLQSASQLTGESTSRTNFGLNQTDEMITSENRKTGMEIISGEKNRSQWLASSRNISVIPPDTDFKRNPDKIIGPNTWGTESMFSETNARSIPKINTPDTKETMAPPSLPNALWLFGLGIIGIISVRRTSDHSNVT